MALSITGAVSVATADHFATRTMLLAALGCNLAWEIIDAGMYLMARLGERGRNALAVRAIRETVNREDAHLMIAEELPPLLAPALQPTQLEFIRERINKVPASDVHARLTRRDWRGALGVCILVIVSTFPVVIPFIVIADARLALRISNALAVILLFLCGFLFGRYAGTPASGDRSDYGGNRCCPGEYCDSHRRVKWSVQFCDLLLCPHLQLLWRGRFSLPAVPHRDKPLLAPMVAQLVSAVTAGLRSKLCPFLQVARRISLN